MESQQAPIPENTESSKTMTIDELCQDAHAIAKEKGWWESGKRNAGEIFANIHSEVTEAWEEWRAGRAPAEIYMNTEDPAKPEGIPIELADVLIRIADYCAHHRINLNYAVFLKMNYNRRRSHRHGGKLA